MHRFPTQASGGDADDEDFFITIKFDIFAKPDIDPTLGLAEVRIFHFHFFPQLPLSLFFLELSLSLSSLVGSYESSGLGD